MAKLSRTKRYQDLRDHLDEETTQAQTAPVKTERLSRVQSSSSNTLPHAAKALFPHEEVQAKTTPAQDLPVSPVMDELLGEVKQYNIANGNRYTDDTQINILKQLDDPGSDSIRRKSHVLPMEEPEESAGSTMEIETAPKPSVIRETVTEAMVEEVATPEPKKDAIVLSAQDIRADEDVLDDELDLFTTGSDDLEETIETSVLPGKKEKKEKPRKKKKVKKARQKAVVPADNEVQEDAQPVEMPSAKMRMKVEAYDEETPARKAKKSSTILNVILVVLILALIAAIGFMVYFIKNLGL